MRSRVDKHMFDHRSTAFLSTTHWSGPPSNPDYADLRNSTGQGPMSHLPAVKNTSFTAWLLGTK